MLEIKNNANPSTNAEYWKICVYHSHFSGKYEYQVTFRKILANMIIMYHSDVLISAENECKILTIKTTEPKYQQTLRHLATYLQKIMWLSDIVAIAAWSKFE